MEVNRPNSQANDIAMQKLQEQLLKAQEDGVDGIPTIVEVTRPDGEEIPDDEVRIEITGGTEIERVAEDSSDIEDTDETSSQSIQDSPEEEDKDETTSSKMTDNAEQNNIPSIEQIIASWQNQANIERFQQGIGAEFSNLLNPYQIQGKSSVLSFEDLVKIGEYYSKQSTQNISDIPQISDVSKTSETSSSVMASEAKTTQTQTTTSNVKIIDGEKNIGSAEYAAKILKMALPDSNLEEMLVYYDRMYDEQGRLVGLSKNSIYNNINLPDLKIEYLGEDSKNKIKNCITISWVDNNAVAQGVVINHLNDDTIQTLVVSDEKIINARKYDVKENCIEFSKTLAAGESCTFRGIKVSNPTKETIDVTYDIKDGKMSVNAKNATITDVEADDAISTDKVYVGTKTYAEYKGSSSSTSSSSDSLSTLSKLVSNLSSVVNSLKK